MLKLDSRPCPPLYYKELNESWGFCLPAPVFLAVYMYVPTPYSAAIVAIIYIFMLWFLLLLSFFRRLISAVGDSMCTILPHMVWP